MTLQSICCWKVDQLEPLFWGVIKPKHTHLKRLTQVSLKRNSANLNLNLNTLWSKIHNDLTLEMTGEIANNYVNLCYLARTRYAPELLWDREVNTQSEVVLNIWDMIPATCAKLCCWLWVGVLSFQPAASQCRCMNIQTLALQWNEFFREQNKHVKHALNSYVPHGAVCSFWDRMNKVRKRRFPKKRISAPSLPKKIQWK